MTDERIKELAKKWCLYPTDNAWDEVMGFAYDLIAEEREACAKVCEEYNKRQCYNDEDMAVANECAKAIRARGNHD